jgi:tRNA pseudouridine55 synthase
MAEGVLPICLGKATRLIEFMDRDGAGDEKHSSKAYECEMRLGVTTDTLDVWGCVTAETSAERALHAITTKRIDEVFSSLTGDIDQTPPAYSAIKYKGKKLYEYARSGEEVPAEAIRPRRVRIEKLDVCEIIFDSDDPDERAALSSDRRLHDPRGSDAYDRGFATIKFSVLCSKGTYVRAIVRDVGAALGCGAAMSALIRTKSGMFSLADAYTKKDVEFAANNAGLCDIILPLDAAISFMPEMDIGAAGGGKFVNGVSVRDTCNASPESMRYRVPGRGPFHVRVYDDGRFLGVGMYDDGIIRPCKVIA